MDTTPDTRRARADDARAVAAEALDSLRLRIAEWAELEEAAALAGEYGPVHLALAGEHARMRADVDRFTAHLTYALSPGSAHDRAPWVDTEENAR